MVNNNGGNKVSEIINAFTNGDDKQKDVDQTRLMATITTEIFMEVLKHDKFEDIKKVFFKKFFEIDSEKIIVDINKEWIESDKYIENDNYNALNILFKCIADPNLYSELKPKFNKIYEYGINIFDSFVGKEIERLEKDKDAENVESIINKDAWCILSVEKHKLIKHNVSKTL
ncbi:hypothetical protein CWI42_051240 [Ordospora colligata]|uniref:Uncharacterized protein n=1 Tax=Ordospora colligata OC4 TaxID=1354746 RepID=A0A0B2UKI0_9MICR|nr:uncharacterized protein M896_051280 [Ordospora colligata OC4]KHN69719.1 hypothetical protein M896_051280 [Ordospora colligata OC4]TBU15681.1 hypothetical protein CWI41_051270 [Ordospora colligata]TBU18641.1 hypothetical protein CWI42_051240 [Ordospora colligata]